MITMYYRNLKDPALTKIDKFRAGAWIHVQAPTAEDLQTLVEKYDLDEGILRDALDRDEMPRLENEGESTYLITRYTYVENGRHVTAPILLAVAPKFILSLSALEVPNMEAIISGRITVITTQKAKLLLQIIRSVVATYGTGLNTINRQIRGARAGLNVANISNRNFIQFVGLEDALNDFLSELVPTNVILSGLVSGKQNMTFYDEDEDLIEDLVLSTRQSIEASKSNLRTIVNIREAYSNIMTNNLNRQIKLLTSLTIILMIPNIIAGFFGMNVSVPLGEFKHGFSLIVLGTLALCGYLVWLFNRNRWL